MRARVFVTLKPSVFDPQGTTVTEALHSLGYDAVKDVRQGKYFELEIAAATAAEARRIVSEAADKLLSNPVIESYRIEVEEGLPAERPPEGGRQASAGPSGRDATRPEAKAGPAAPKPQAKAGVVA